MINRIIKKEKWRAVKKCLIFMLLWTFFSNCTDFFKPEDFSFSKIENSDQLEDAVGGITDYFKLYISRSSFCIAGIFGDDQLTFNSNSNIVSFSSSNYYSSYRGLSECKKGIGNFDLLELPDWSECYTMIASINNAITQFDAEKEKDSKIRRLLGELYFYRAYCYYRLTRIYGRIPLVRNTDVDYNLPRSSYVEVYKFIESDLLSAMKLLPINNASARIPYETPDRGIVKAMLAEVYLSWAGFPANDPSKYQLSAKISGELIDSSEFYNYELLADFEDLWNKKSLHNNEAVFCKYFDRRDYNISSIYLYCGKYYPLTSTSSVAQNRSYGFSVDRKTELKISENLMPEIEYYNNYPKGYRKDVTFYTSIYVKPDIFRSDIDTGYFNIEKVDCKSRACYRKFFIDTVLFRPIYEYQITDGFDFMGCPRIYLLRYAQTLLTFAEASARSGNLDAKAYECINKVRRRANKQNINAPSLFDLSPGLSKEAFADSVVQERSWELAGEQSHRWFDMVRLGIVENVLEKQDPMDGGAFKYSSNDKYFFSLPKGDVNLNQNLAN
jgi:hypothetical protein